jgi:hypothetical protein
MDDLEVEMFALSKGTAKFPAVMDKYDEQQFMQMHYLFLESAIQGYFQIFFIFYFSNIEKYPNYIIFTVSKMIRSV